MAGGVRAPDRYAGVAMAVRLVARCQQRPQTLAQLADHFGVSTRTIRRLIDALRLGGIAIEQEYPADKEGRPLGSVYRVRE